MAEHPSDYSSADSVRRMVKAAERLAGAPRPERPPMVMLTAVGFLAALEPGGDDERVFVCSVCSALVLLDGTDRHALWHGQLDAVLEDVDR